MTPHLPRVVSLRVGMTVVSGYSTTDEVLREADTAMYRAQAGGKNRVEVFDGGVRAAARHAAVPVRH